MLHVKINLPTGEYGCYASSVVALCIAKMQIVCSSLDSSYCYPFIHLPAFPVQPIHPPTPQTPLSHPASYHLDHPPSSISASSLLGHLPAFVSNDPRPHVLVLCRPDSVMAPCHLRPVRWLRRRCSAAQRGGQVVF